MSIRDIADVGLACSHVTHLYHIYPTRTLIPVNPSSIPGSTLENCSNPIPNPNPNPNPNRSHGSHLYPSPDLIVIAWPPTLNLSLALTTFVIQDMVQYLLKEHHPQMELGPIDSQHMYSPLHYAAEGPLPPLALY